MCNNASIRHFVCDSIRYRCFLLFSSSSLFFLILIVSKKGQLRAAFMSFQSICCGWHGTLEEKAASCLACSQKKRKRAKKNCQANRQSLLCLLCLIDVAPSQSLNHTQLSSHERPGNTEMPHSDRKHCHGSAPAPQYKITV